MSIAHSTCHPQQEQHALHIRLLSYSGRNSRLGPKFRTPGDQLIQYHWDPVVSSRCEVAFAIVYEVRAQSWRLFTYANW